MNTIDISQSQEIYTVSRLNREVRFLVEGSFPLIWIEGEISNFTIPQSGHWYFSLKDHVSQVRCAMFKLQNKKINWTPKDGMHIFAKVRVSLYEGRGDFQLLVDYLEDAGIGKLQKEFEALKKRLGEKGLFDIAHKKKCPEIPRCIGVITSKTGAAIQDILHILKRRYPLAPIILYPTLVQGESAAPNIVSAIQLADRRKECDVLILARGGGTIEDLWPFNDETVAHAIFHCQIPIITGIGHEIDFTIADFVADLRAPTPSAAAECATPDSQTLQKQLQQKENQLIRLVRQKIEQKIDGLKWVNKHLQQLHPKRRLTELAQKLDYSELQLARLQHKYLNTYQTKMHELSTRLLHANPHIRIQNLQHQVQHKKIKLEQIALAFLQFKQQILTNLSIKLDVLSPLSTLQRGFSITTKNQKIVHSIKQVKISEKVDIRLNDGRLKCTIEHIENK